MTSPVVVRSSVQLALDRDFGILLWGKLAVNSAVWAQTVVAVVLTYQLTGSAGWVGVVGAAQLGPQLLLGLVSGRLSDAHGPLRQMVGGGVLSGIATLGLAVWLVPGGDAPGLVAVIPIVVASAVFGCGQALATPALQSAVPRLVSSDELSSAVALNYMPTAVARTVGPAGGALLVALWGPAVSLVLIGLVLMVSGLSFLLIRSPGLRAGAAAGADNRITSAVRYVWRDRVVLLLLVGVGAIGFGSEPAITLAPVLMARVGHAGDGAWVSAAFGVGGLLGVAAHQLLRRRFSPLAIGCLMMTTLAGAMAAMTVVGSLNMLLCALALGGVSMVAGITALSVAVQERCEPSMLGRVMALWVIAFAGVRPLAGVVLGYVSDHWSTPAALTLASVVTVTVAATAYPWIRALQTRTRVNAG
jgi:predicted MFS family arabinose efflux permease